MAANGKRGHQLIVEALKEAEISLVCTLPDLQLLDLITAVDRDVDLIHVPLCREEEGIGICAGAYLAGKKGAVVMQNAGLLNACNALTTTALNFQIPMLLLVYYAGDIGDRGFSVLGSVTEPVLRGLGLRTFVLRRVEEVKKTIRGAQVLSQDSRQPVALLLTREVLQ